MSKNCPIMQRMKENYESRSRHLLTRRTPVIIRLDGKAFHTYTRGLDKPFDKELIEDMQQTAIYLCENIQGAKCAYVQSDEISILVTDYYDLKTDAWFNYNIQKMTSISASLATGKFNYERNQRDAERQGREGFSYDPDLMKLAFFDSRVFNIPKEEVANYFLARQKDAKKNSISMLAQSLYSHKELHGKNGNEMQEMCFQKGHNWNDLPFEQKRGSFIVKKTFINGEPLKRNFYIENNKLKYNGLPSPKQMELLNSNYLIRNKWVLTETPNTFVEEVFKQWTK